MPFKLKRIYEKPAPEDGFRVLVDRIWPRGIKKEEASLGDWLKEIAPTSELRRWFSHSPEKWPEFRKRYFQELEERGESIRVLREKGKKGTVTLVFAAKDSQRNNASALKEYLESPSRWP